MRRQHSDWATGIMTDESWIDSRQGQSVLSALQNIHTHSASSQCVPGSLPKVNTPYHTPPSRVDAAPPTYTNDKQRRNFVFLRPHSAHKVAVRPVILLPCRQSDCNIAATGRQQQAAGIQSGGHFRTSGTQIPALPFVCSANAFWQCEPPAAQHNHSTP